MPLTSYITQWINENPGKTVGAVIGFILGLLVLAVGPVKTLIVIILSAIGVVVGKIFDENIELPGFSFLKKKRGRKKPDNEDDDEFY
jgi:uncharacterized membrane protein